MTIFTKINVSLWEAHPLLVIFREKIEQKSRYFKREVHGQNVDFTQLKQNQKMSFSQKVSKNPI